MLGLPDTSLRGVFVGDIDSDLCRIRSYSASLREVVGVCNGVPLFPRRCTGVDGSDTSFAGDDDVDDGVWGGPSVRSLFRL